MSKSVFFLSHKSIFTYCVYPCSNYPSSQCSFDRRSRHKKYNYIYCQGHTVTGISYSKDMSWRAWSDHSWARDNLLASRQRNNVIKLQGWDTFWSMLWSRCLSGVATMNIVIMQYSTTVFIENMATLLRQCCRVTSSRKDIRNLN